MKKVFAISLGLFLCLVMSSISLATLTDGKMILKVGDEVYVCGCGESCPCLTMSNTPGECVCNKALVKGKITNVEDSKATVMVNGKEQIFPTQGKYVCSCGPNCHCDTISQTPGKCGCGAEMKPVSSSPSTEKGHVH